MYEINTMQEFISFTNKLSDALDYIDLPEGFSVNIVVPATVCFQLAEHFAKKYPKARKKEVITSILLTRFNVNLFTRGDD